MNITKKIVFLIIQILVVIYALLPLPAIPNLPDSVVSTEPGDTVQLKNVKAFFTNSDRKTVMHFFDQSLRSSLPFSIRLNHPPEYAKQIFKDTMQTYYLEEIVFPFKGSVFINGYEWANDVFTKPDKREKNKIIVNGTEYQAKISLRTFYSPVPFQLAYIFLTEIGIYSIIILVIKAFRARK